MARNKKKIAGLVKSKKELRKENSRLIKRLNHLREILRIKNRLIEELESKLNIAKFDLSIAKAQAGTE